MSKNNVATTTNNVAPLCTSDQTLNVNRVQHVQERTGGSGQEGAGGGFEPSNINSEDGVGD